MARVRLRSLALTRHGPRKCWDRMVEFLQALGFDVCESLVSRIDCATDSVCDPQILLGAVAEGHYVTLGRGRKSPWGDTEPGNRETVYVGSREEGQPYIQIRVYDKGVKIQKDMHKAGEPGVDMLRAIARRMSGPVTNEDLLKRLLRVEIEVNGKWLREKFKYRTVEEYLDNLGPVMEYMEGYFRVISGSPKGKKTSRLDTHPEWEAISAARKWIYGEGQAERKDQRMYSTSRERKCNIKYHKALKLLAEAMALEAHHYGDVGEVADGARYHIARQGQAFLDRVHLEKLRLYDNGVLEEQDVQDVPTDGFWVIDEPWAAVHPTSDDLAADPSWVQEQIPF